MEEKRPKARREYKDTVFRMLFSDEKNLLSLYNAVTGRSYEDAKELEIVTLDNAVYMGMKNDLAFLLDLFVRIAEDSCSRVYRVLQWRGGHGGAHGASTVTGI